MGIKERQERDKEAVRGAIEWLLGTVGLQVHAFGSGQEFLDRFDASVECRAVTCLYHSTNWWLEELIEAAGGCQKQRASRAIRALRERLAADVAELDAPTLPMPAEDNPFLPGFYHDPRRYAFQVQLWFLLNRFRQHETLARSLRTRARGKRGVRAPRGPAGRAGADVDG